MGKRGLCLDIINEGVFLVFLWIDDLYVSILNGSFFYFNFFDF